MEVRNTYLDARFINGLQFKDYATVKVTVEDVDEPPVFTRNPYIIEVHEDTAAGSFVGVVSARDPDADNKAVKYAVFGAKSRSQDGHFHLQVFLINGQFGERFPWKLTDWIYSSSLSRQDKILIGSLV